MLGLHTRSLGDRACFEARATNPPGSCSIEGGFGPTQCWQGQQFALEMGTAGLRTTLSSHGFGQSCALCACARVWKFIKLSTSDACTLLI